MKILFVIKDKADSSWSSSLDLIAEELVKLNIADILYIRKDLDKEFDVKKYDYIYINHSICFYLFLVKFKFFRFDKITFIPHEGEPFLGWYFAIKNKQLYKFGSWLRFSKLYNLLPYYLSNNTLCLSCIQKKIYKKSDVVNILGVDEKVFAPINRIQIDRDIFFPSKISSPEKNFKAIEFLSEKYSLLFPDNTPNEQMPSLYSRSNLVVIPSLFESYGLVVIEAMLTNSLILVNPNVGVICELLRLYTVSELESHGIYLNDFKDKTSIISTVDNLIDKRNDIKISTRKLALDFGFSSEQTSRGFINYVHRKNI